MDKTTNAYIAFILFLLIIAGVMISFQKFNIKAFIVILIFTFILMKNSLDNKKNRN